MTIASSYIRKVGGTSTGALTSTDLFADLGDDAIIDGETVFEIVINATGWDSDSFVKTKVADVTSNVTFFQGEDLTGSAIINLFVPMGTSKELLVNTK